MNKIEKWSDVEEAVAGDFPKLKVGPLVCVITDVVNVPDREYLEVDYDIDEGENKGYYAKNSQGRWRGFIIRSYKDSSLPYFKGFITSVEKSNASYKWDWDEKKLIGKKIVVNFREEEYVNKDGEVKTIVKGFEFRSTESLKQGKVKTHDKLWTLEDQHKERPHTEPTITDTATGEKISDDDLPF